jgi:hypothetical protein
MARRVTRTAVHVLIPRANEPPAPVRVTRAVTHVLLIVPRVPVIDEQPTAGASGVPLPPFVVEIRKGGVKDTSYNGLVTAIRKSGNPTLTGVLRKQASGGEVVFDEITPIGGGELEIDFVPDGGEPVTSDPITVTGGSGGGLTTTFRTRFTF